MSLQFWQGFFDGAMAMLALLLAVVGLWVRAIRRAPQKGRAFAAGFVRGFGRSTGCESLLVISGGSPVIVSFGEVARAIERGDMLTHAPVPVTRSDVPPPPPSHDGTA